MSSYNTVDAVLKSISSLVYQLKNASTDMQSSTKDRTKAEGMYKKLQSCTILAELALMKHILAVLKNLSLYLQSRSASILDVGLYLETVVWMLTAMKSVDGLVLSEFNSKVAADGYYCGISVSRTSSDVSTFMQMRLQFIQALVDNIVEARRRANCYIAHPLVIEFISVGASLVIDFCISGPSTGNSTYRHFLQIYGGGR